MSERLRIVIDTNVFVAAVTSAEGVSARLLLLVRAGQANLIVSPMLLDELTTVLERQKFRRHLNLDEVRRYVADVRAFAEIVVDPPASDSPITMDPDDDFLVALAESVRADALVSGDANLTELHRPGFTVLMPRMALDALGSR